MQNTQVTRELRSEYAANLTQQVAHMQRVVNAPVSIGCPAILRQRPAKRAEASPSRFFGWLKG